MTLEIYLHVLVEDQIYFRLLFCIFPWEKKSVFRTNTPDLIKSNHLISPVIPSFE